MSDAATFYPGLLLGGAIAAIAIGWSVLRMATNALTDQAEKHAREIADAKCAAQFYYTIATVNAQTAHHFAEVIEKLQRGDEEDADWWKKE